MQARTEFYINNLWIYRIYLLLGGILYPCWVPLEIYINHNFSSYLERSIIAGIYLTFLALSFKIPKVEKHLEKIVVLCFFIMIGHYFTEIHRNNANAAAIEGFHIITTATLICIQNIRWMAVYLVYAYVGISLTYIGLENPGIKWFHFMAAFSTIMTGNVLVLTLRKRLEKRLIKEHQNFQLLFDKNLEGLAILSKENKIIQTNEYFDQLFSKINLGENINSYIDFKDQNVFEQNIKNKITNEEKILQFKIRNIEFNGENAKMLSVSDLTAKKRDELNIMNSSKMAALGEMAGGIAHEINNPLAVIKGYSDLLRRVKIDNEVSKSKILSLSDSISRTVERIAKIISGLRRFARDGAGDTFERKNISELFDDVLQFNIEKIKQDNIEVIVNVDKDLDLDCQPIQLQQVLMNLVNNAHFELKNTTQDKKWIRIVASEFQIGWIQIFVQDNGPGIPKELQQKIMQPFFTTKPVGTGSGLGLSISKGIIEAHQGRFYLQDKESVSHKKQLKTKRVNEQDLDFQNDNSIVSAVQNNESEDINENMGAKFVIEIPRFQAPQNSDQINNMTDSTHKKVS